MWEIHVQCCDAFWEISYIFYLSGFLIEFGKFHPQSIWFSWCKFGVNSLNSFSVSVDYLWKENNSFNMLLLYIFEYKFTDFFRKILNKNTRGAMLMYRYSTNLSWFSLKQFDSFVPFVNIVGVLPQKNTKNIHRKINCISNLLSI